MQNLRIEIERSQSMVHWADYWPNLWWLECVALCVDVGSEEIAHSILRHECRSEKVELDDGHVKLLIQVALLL